MSTVPIKNAAPGVSTIADPLFAGLDALETCTVTASDGRQGRGRVRSHRSRPGQARPIHTLSAVDVPASWRWTGSPPERN